MEPVHDKFKWLKLSHIIESKVIFMLLVIGLWWECVVPFTFFCPSTKQGHKLSIKCEEQISVECRVTKKT